MYLALAFTELGQKSGLGNLIEPSQGYCHVNESAHSQAGLNLGKKRGHRTKKKGEMMHGRRSNLYL